MPGRGQIHKALPRLEPPNAPALLVHGDEHGAGRGGPQHGRQTTELLRGANVALASAGQIAVKKQHMSHFPGAHRRQKRIARREFRAAKTQHQHGAEHAVKRGGIGRIGRGSACRTGRAKLCASQNQQAAERKKQPTEQPPPQTAGC